MHEFLQGQFHSIIVGTFKYLSALRILPPILWNSLVSAVPDKFVNQHSLKHSRQAF
jgi:hypothetical protein